MEKQLGRILSVEYGFGGYDGVQFGVSFDLRGKDWRVTDFWGHWANHNERCKWTIADQHARFLEFTLRLKELLESAGNKTLSELEGMPLEATFENDTLKSWRILTEVL